MPLPAFASVTDLRTLLGKTREALPDDRARVALTIASNAMRAYCGWQLSRSVVVGEVFTGNNRPALWLRTLYLVSIDAVTENGVALSTAGYTFTRYGRVTRTVWGGWNGSVVLSYTHGYAEGSYEATVLQGVCLTAAARIPENPSGRRSWTVGGESAAMAGTGTEVMAALSLDEKQQLDPFRLEQVG